MRGKLAEETAKSVEDDKDSKLPQNATVIEEDKQNCSTQRSLAIAAVKEKRVFHVPEAGSFVVKGSKGDNYSVRLYPEKCQCPSIGTCYHIMAVKMSIGEEDIEEKRILNLTQLRKNSRKRANKKAGTKKQRPCDQDISIIAAPGSVVKRNPEWDDDCMGSPLPCLPLSDMKKPTSIMKRKRPDDKERNEIARKRIKFDEDNVDSEKDHPQHIYIEADDNTIPPCENTADERRKWTEYGKQMLTFQHKNDINSDKMLCSDIINFAQDILQQQFPNIQGFQHTGYAPVLKDEKWEYKLQMKSKKSPAAQINHTGHSHWITSTQQEGEENIKILDSCNKKQNYISQSTQIQLGKIYGSGEKAIKVSVSEVKQQQNGVDCGVYAIANLTEFCFTGNCDNQPVNYDINNMRSHLVKCINDKKFTPFPRRPQQKKRLSLSKKDKI